MQREGAREDGERALGRRTSVQGRRTRVAWEDGEGAREGTREGTREAEEERPREGQRSGEGESPERVERASPAREPPPYAEQPPPYALLDAYGRLPTSAPPPPPLTSRLL